MIHKQQEIHMAHWTQQITETYRALQEAELLQVELAKAKLLIAQLSEEKKIVGERPEKGPHVREQKPKIYVKGKDGNYEPKPIPTQQQNTSPQSTNEQAQYIFSLENAVIALAELSEGRLGDAVAAIKVRIKQAFGGPSPKQIEQKKRNDEYWKAARALPPAPEDSRSWPIGSYYYPDSASGASGTKNEQTEYISSLENTVIALAESMNMSVEELIEGEKRNIRLQKALQKAGDNVRIGNTKLAAMDSHIRDVATTQGGSAGQAASNALYRQKGKTKSAVSQAIEKSTKLSAALDTSTNQVRNSRAARVARGSFSDSPNEQRQADRVRSIGNEPKERNWRAATSTDSLAAQGKLPAKKFGSPGDQRTNLSAMRSDAYAARLKHAEAQSTAAKARNQANRPV